MIASSTTLNLGKYIFIDGILQPQTIEKGVLAYFYDCTPTTFRSQLQRKGITGTADHSKTYTKAEVEQIFAEFGPVYYESALEAWKKYLIFRQKKQKSNKNRKKTHKKSSFLPKFAI